MGDEFEASQHGNGRLRALAMEADRESMRRFGNMKVATFGDSKLIFVAGHVAQNTALDIIGQTREALALLDGMLEHAGARREHMVSASIFLACAEDYAAMNSVWNEWVGPGRSAVRAMVGAKLLQNSCKLEVEVTAAYTPAKLTQDRRNGFLARRPRI